MDQYIKEMKKKKKEHKSRIFFSPYGNPKAGQGFVPFGEVELVEPHGTAEWVIFVLWHL